MKVDYIGQSVRYVGGYGDAKTIESAARTCTQTEVGSNPEGFVERLVDNEHMSPVEFGYADFEIECDRGIQQELTRHRHFSFNVESSRLCDYTKKPLRFVTKPPKGMDVPEGAIALLEEACYFCAIRYEQLIAMGAPRDYARKVLPLATASKMRMAGNTRAWLEMLPKRLSRRAHPEIREVASMVMSAMRARFGRFFS